MPKLSLYTRSANESKLQGGNEDHPCLYIWIEETNRPYKMENHWENSEEKYPIYSQLPRTKDHIENPECELPHVPEDRRLRFP
ncbi:hypothetical protein D623_10019610 [Myotis brandtii]|uniref:Uncharacterized protein n=1 Tax=Myotis brandtii TaxID=109478 RepID=S7Q1N9_MYOBR|nr:hypothetical protein D623_10019610 [Myotis brandtii]